MQQSLFEKNQQNILLQGSELDYFSSLLSEKLAGDYFDKLLLDIDWQTETIKIAGQDKLCPRLTAWYGDRNAEYRYSGILHQPNSWNPSLLLLKQQVEAATKHRFNSALCNLYRNGEDSVAWHSDDEPELYGPKGEEPIIASLSLGATRKFQLKHKTRKDLRHHLSLTSGSLLLMKGATQTHWLHQIPKERGIELPRINITFRQIHQ